MTVPEDASDLWFFDSHKNSKRSPWLQSTLSELEGKTKAMLKLIEGDADTFAQRAEMYYKKRPELVSTIEEFYRAYRSLAERHDQLRLESGYTFSNRGWLFKDWNATDKSSESSSVVSEYMVSEVDDPESDEDQVESKFTDMPKKSGSIPIIQTSEVMSGGFQGMLKDGVATNPVTAETKDINSDSSNITTHTARKHSELAVGKSNENNSKDILEMAKKSNARRIKNIADESLEPFTKSDSEKSKGCNSEAINVIETASKLSQFVNESYPKDIPEMAKKNDPLSLLIEDGRIKIIAEELSEPFTKSNSNESKTCVQELVLESYPKDFLEMAKMGDPLSLLIEDGRIKIIAEESSEPFTKSNSNKSKTYVPELDKGKDVARLTSQVEKLREENVTFRCELERKDDEKREVIRQLTLSMDILREENVCMRKFIKESRSSSVLSKFKDLKGVFRGKIFWSRYKYQTTLVAL